MKLQHPRRFARLSSSMPYIQGRLPWRLTIQRLAKMTSPEFYVHKEMSNVQYQTPSTVLICDHYLLGVHPFQPDRYGLFCTTSPRSHLFSSSSSLMRPSIFSILAVISFASFSNACSRIFFFARNLALARVLRRRLSSSAAARAFSSRGSNDVSSGTTDDSSFRRLVSAESSSLTAFKSYDTVSMNERCPV